MRIKEVCKEKGITVSQLAEKMGIKQESLSRAINGNPTLETLERIANALEVDVPELFTSSSSGGIIGVIRIRDTNYNINSVPDLSRLLDRIESGEMYVCALVNIKIKRYDILYLMDNLFYRCRFGR